MSQTMEDKAGEQPKLFDGFLTQDQVLAETGWSARTLKRRVDEGFPVAKFGNTKLYPIDKDRAWLLSRVHEQSAARPRGRPRKESKAS